MVIVAVVYGPVILDHFRNPRNARLPASPDRTAEASNPVCGDRVRLGWRLRDDRVTEVGFQAEACAICTAAASLLTERMKERSETELGALTERELIDSLNSEIPTDRQRCATLPLEALRAALPSGPRAQTD